MPATRKQKIGNVLVQQQVFTSRWDYVLTIEGIITGTAASIATDRVALLALQDNLKHAYTDGNSERDGNYIITSLLFRDDSRTASPVTNLRYTMILLQDQYTGGDS